jgi:Excreted virulence factor EspC, type VII ESX diderm
MSFSADHEAIRGFGQVLAGLTDDASRAQSYVRDALGIGYKDGRMFFTVVETATSVREALSANYGHLARLIDASATEVDKTAKNYRDTDHASAARLDGAY